MESSKFNLILEEILVGSIWFATTSITQQIFIQIIWYKHALTASIIGWDCGVSLLPPFISVLLANNLFIYVWYYTW